MYVNLDIPSDLVEGNVCACKNNNTSMLFEVKKSASKPIVNLLLYQFNIAQPALRIDQV